MPAAVNGMKECTKCGETKDVSEYGKRTRKYDNDGLKPQCKACRRKYRQATKERQAERSKKCRDGNPERYKSLKKLRLENMPAAVYAITNTLNGKLYIGQSSQYPNRCYQHKSHLRRNTHENSKLQFDFNRYGEDAFEFSAVYEFPPHTPSSILLEQEKVEIAKRLQKGDELYNSQFPSTELLESNVIEVDFAPEVLNLMISVCDEEGITFQDMVSIMNIIQERNPNLDILTKINNPETKEE